MRRGTLVVHLAPPTAMSNGADAPVAKAGLVVSRAVGGSVTRHTVARRLRALTVPQLAGLPAGSRLVVRALPEAATATSAELAADLAAAITAARRRWQP